MRRIGFCSFKSHGEERELCECGHCFECGNGRRCSNDRIPVGIVSNGIWEWITTMTNKTMETQSAIVGRSGWAR